MVNRLLLNIEVQEYAKSYEGEVSTIAFRKSPFEGISVQELIQLVEGYRKSKRKLPSWYQLNSVYFPPKLNLEQTSSEITAKYKSTLVKGTSVADISGGFGVDSFYFSKVFKEVSHVERNSRLSDMVAHNFKELEANNIECHSQDGLDFISNKRFDLIYIDPSRRHHTKGKVFFLNDCEPNVPMNLDMFFECADILMVKTSPMLDLAVGLEELKMVKAVHIVSVNNEVKELLWILERGYSEPPEIHTVNLKGVEKQHFTFQYGIEGNYHLSAPQAYLYEPNASIMKSGGFNVLAEQLSLSKLHNNTHLFTSNIVFDFPGRAFEVLKTIDFKKSEVAKLDIKKANVATRNFPLNVREIRKRFKIADGGHSYLFFVTISSPEKRIVIICRKIN